LRQLYEKTHGWLRDAGDFGVSLLLVLLIVDLLFPGSTGIVANVSQILEGMSVEGRYSLIAMFLFLLVYTRRRGQSGGGGSTVEA